MHTFRASRTSSFLVVATTLLLVAGGVACAGGSSAETTAEPAAEPAPGSAPAPSSSGETGQSVNAAGLGFDLPSGWQPEQPASSMRIGQAQIPGSGGAGLLTVFFFGPGGGGGVDANLNRWIGQVDSTGEPTRESFEAGAYKITWVEHSGTLLASQMPNSFPSSNQPDYTLFGAVVEGAGGPWFFKAVGPQATMAENRDGFVGMLKSARQGN